jgi:hypothetical protein
VLDIHLTNALRSIVKRERDVRDRELFPEHRPEGWRYIVEKHHDAIFETVTGQV